MQTERAELPLFTIKYVHFGSLNTKARYIRKSSLGRSRLIYQSRLKCAGQIQNGGRFEFKEMLAVSAL